MIISAMSVTRAMKAAMQCESDKTADRPVKGKRKNNSVNAN